MKRVLTAIALFLTLPAAFAEPRDYYSEADKLYRENRWAEVVSLCLEGLSQQDMPESSAIELHSVLGASYARLGAFGKAADSMKKCLDYDVSQGETKGLTSSLINLASMYVYAGEPEEGEEYALRAIENEESVGRPVYLARAYGKACDVYHALGRDEEALEYADKAVAVAESSLGEVQAAIRRSQRAYALGGLGRRAEALAELDAAEAVFRTNDAKQSLSVVCFQKAQEYGRNGDIEAEVRYLQEAHLLASEMRDLPLVQKITDYEIARRAETVDLQNAKLDQDRHMKRGLFLIVFILALAATVTALSLKRSRRSERLLGEACEKKDWLLRALSHDLRSPQQAQLSGIRMLRHAVGTLSPEEEKQSLAQMEMASEAELEHIDNVLGWASRDARKESVRFDLSALVAEIMRQYGKAAELKGVVLTSVAPPEIFVSADRGGLSLAIRNLLSNAVKFTEPGKEVTITVESGSRSASVCVADEGIGIAPEDLSVFLSGGSLPRRPGTAGEPTSGLGLSVTKALVEDSGGKLKIDSAPGKGSRFTIKIPYESN